MIAVVVAAAVLVAAVLVAAGCGLAVVEDATLDSSD